jgi:hypothetical protein
MGWPGGLDWLGPIIVGLHINKPDPIWAMWANESVWSISFYFIFFNLFLFHFDVLVSHNYQFYSDIIV